MATLDEIKSLFATNTEEMNKGFSGVKEEIKTVNTELKKLKTSLAESTKAMNEKITGLENQLKEKNEEILALRKDFDVHKRKNNLVLFNVEEKESPHDLEEIILKLLQEVTEIEFYRNDLNDVFRIGKASEKCRPILISFVSHKKLLTVLTKKQLFRKKKMTISQDLPKEILEERKRLQPMISHLNNLGKKTVMRLDEVFVEGKKLGKKELEEEYIKFTTMQKRTRSPSSEDNASGERRIIPRLNFEGAMNSSSSQMFNENTAPTSASPSLPSTPSRLFPMFQLNSVVPKNILSPVAGGSRNDKLYEFHSDK